MTTTPFKQSLRKVTKAQLQFFQQETQSLNKHCRNLIGHVLVNQKRRYTTIGYEGWQGVPVPRESAIDPLFGGDLGKQKGYTWEHVEHLLQRDYYSIEEHKCYCYTLPHAFVEKFIDAAEDVLLDVNKIRDERFYSWDPDSETFRVERENKMVRNPDKRPTTPINLRAASSYLQREKDSLQQARQHRDTLLQQNNLREAEQATAKLDKLQRKYHHNLYCYQTIVQNLTSANWKEGTAEYLQQTFQPDPGLRFYEKGGGLQCSSREFKEALVRNMDVINVDAKSCHLTITITEMKAAGIQCPLEEMVNNSYQIDMAKLGYDEGSMHFMTRDTIKTAALAVINGAKLTTNIKEKFKTLPKLVREQEDFKHESEAFLTIQLEILVKYLTPLHNAVKQWEETLPEHDRMPRVTAFLQRKEVELLTELKQIACNDQHDGALIRTEDYHKLANTDTGYLTVLPKNITNPSQTLPQSEIADMEQRAKQATATNEVILRYTQQQGKWKWVEEDVNIVNELGIPMLTPPGEEVETSYKWEVKLKKWVEITTKLTSYEETHPLSTDKYIKILPTNTLKNGGIS